LWIYAYELGNVKLQKGHVDEALSLADALYAQNTENISSYVLYSGIYRMSGKPKTAVEWADKGLEIMPEDTELMRTKAMALIVQGEFEEAKEVVDEAREIEDYGLLMLVSLVVENELGNKIAVKQVKEDLKEISLEITDRVDDYLDGKMSAKQLFTEGVGDVQ
jgi:tetratricopeptide (TPR) repeat protein